MIHAEYDIAAIGQLYRHRCDCKNGFDELKNPWSRGGHASQPDHGACGRTGLQRLELVHAGGQSDARREPLIRRPLLLAAAGRSTSHSDQTRLYLAPMHAEAGLINRIIAKVHAAIRYVRRTAEQLPKINRWATLLGCIRQRIVGQVALRPPPSARGK